MLLKVRFWLFRKHLDSLTTSITEQLSFSDNLSSVTLQNPIHMCFIHSSVLFQMLAGLHLGRRRLSELQRLTFILMAIWGSPARLVLTAETEQHTRRKKESRSGAMCSKTCHMYVCEEFDSTTQTHWTEKMLKELTQLATSRPHPLENDQINKTNPSKQNRNCLTVTLPPIWATYDILMM